MVAGLQATEMAERVQVYDDVAVPIQVFVGRCSDECRCSHHAFGTLPITVTEEMPVGDLCGDIQQAAAERGLISDGLNRLTLIFGESQQDRVHIVARGESPQQVEWSAWCERTPGEWRQAPRSYFPPQCGPSSALHLGLAREEVRLVVCTCGGPSAETLKGAWPSTEPRDLWLGHDSRLTAHPHHFFQAGSRSCRP